MTLASTPTSPITPSSETPRPPVAPRLARWVAALLCAALFPVVAGCSATRGSVLGPPPPIAPGVVAQLEAEVSTPTLVNDPRWQSQAGRNELVQKLMLLCDYRFAQYQASLLEGRAYRDSIIDEAIFGLATAVGFGPGVQASKILGAVGSGLSFTRTNLDKNFFQDQALPILIRKMTSSRLLKANEILDRLGLPLSRYGEYAALTDIIEYHRCGTVAGALQRISDDATTQEIVARGGSVRLPTPAPSQEVRYGRFTAPQITTKRGVIKRFVPPEAPLPVSEPALDDKILARNSHLKTAFETLTDESIRKVLADKTPEIDLTKPENQNVRATLAQQILVRLGQPPEPKSTAVIRLVQIRAAAQDNASLTRLEEAYRFYGLIR